MLIPVEMTCLATLKCNNNTRELMVWHLFRWILYCNCIIPSLHLMSIERFLIITEILSICSLRELAQETQQTQEYRKHVEQDAAQTCRGFSSFIMPHSLWRCDTYTCTHLQFCLHTSGLVIDG